MNILSPLLYMTVKQNDGHASYWFTFITGTRARYLHSLEIQMLYKLFLESVQVVSMFDVCYEIKENQM